MPMTMRLPPTAGPASAGARYAAANGSGCGLAVVRRSASSRSGTTLRRHRRARSGGRVVPESVATATEPGPGPGSAAKNFLRAAGMATKVTSDRNGLAAAPDPVRQKAIRPGESPFVVGIPRDDVREPPAGHSATVRSPQRVRSADGRRAQRLGDAHPEVGDGEGDHERHRGDPVRAWRVTRTKR